MFFVKFVEMRAAKVYAMQTLKESIGNTRKIEKVEAMSKHRMVAQVFASIKGYTLVYCKRKRELAFSAMIFSDKWAVKRGMLMLQDHQELCKWEQNEVD